MRSSEAILRAIANEKGRIPAVKFDEWIGQLIAAGLLEKETINESFYYKLTDKSISYLRKKGVEV